MTITQTISKLNELKLFGVAKGLEEQMNNSATYSLSFEERIALLIDQEQTHRDNLRLERLLKAAKLKSSSACLEDIDYSPKRGLDRQLIANLISSDWINKGFNLIITGSTGTGKTWLACAFGNYACRKGYTVMFCRVPLLLEELQVAHGDGTFNKRLTQIAKVDLLILDDLGISTITTENRDDILEIVDSRSATKSTVITSQLPVEKWHNYLALSNATVADAILDRLLSNENRLVLSGQSMRKVKR